MKVTYKSYLRSVGRKPIPAIEKLRTVKKPGDLVMTHKGVERVQALSVLS